MGNCFSLRSKQNDYLSDIDPEDAKDADILNIIDIILTMDSAYPVINNLPSNSRQRSSQILNDKS